MRAREKALLEKQKSTQQERDLFAKQSQLMERHIKELQKEKEQLQGSLVEYDRSLIDVSGMIGLEWKHTRLGAEGFLT